jgi:regulator of nonsense transcripts 1
MAPTILREKPTKDDDSWRFFIPQEALLPPRNAKDPLLYGKFIKFTADAITFDMQRLPSNRILQSDDRSKFILLSFGDLRFPEMPIKATGDYISRLFKTGLFLNGIQYRFYHHSNSQLVGLITESSECALIIVSALGVASFGKPIPTLNLTIGFTVWVIFRDS